MNDTRAVKIPAYIIKPKVAQVKSLAVQAPFVKSISYPLKGRWASDLGLFNSRRFKIGFGLQNTLIVPTTENALDRDVKSNISYYFTFSWI